jgi:hypothetical protein
MGNQQRTPTQSRATVRKCPTTVLWRGSNARPPESLLSRVNGESASPMQRTNISMTDRTTMSRSLRQHNEAERSAVCRSGEGAAAGVLPGLQTSRSRRRSPSVESHLLTTKKKKNRPLVLHRSKIPHGRSDPGGTSATKTRSHALLLPSTSPNSQGLRRPRQAPRGSRAASRERRVWPICHPWLWRRMRI